MLRSDPPTPKEARDIAKQMFRELRKVPASIGLNYNPRTDNPELFERAAVLADVLLYSDRPELGEALALSVTGHLSPYSTQSKFKHLVSGTLLPLEDRANALQHTLLDIGRILTPLRKPPCMPNMKALKEILVEPVQEENTPYAMGHIRARLQTACSHGLNAAECRLTLEYINPWIQGSGVDRVRYSRRNGSIIEVVYYIAMDRTDDVTLMASPTRRRFWISSYDTMVENVERRYSRRGEWTR